MVNINVKDWISRFINPSAIVLSKIEITIKCQRVIFINGMHKRIIKVVLVGGFVCTKNI